MSVSPGSPELFRIAVVVIGRNEGESLRSCLSSVLSMRYPRDLVEVIYVDSSSSDGSVELAKRLGVGTVALEGPTTAARGRNAGWTQTTAPFVLFLDGDTVLDPDFVVKSLGHFDDATIAGVCGNRCETRGADSIYNAVVDLDWNAPPGWILFFGGDALVRREALVAVGGYNDLLIAGEEPDMCRRMRELGYRILHVDEPMTLHDIAMYRFGQYWGRSVRTGYAYAQIASLYARTADPFWSAESRQNVVRALFWLIAPLFCVALSLILRSLIPILLFVVAALALWGRTAAKATGKTSSRRVLLAYSFHSHFQQLPLFMGQLRFWMGRWRGQHSTLIEYKKTP